MELYRRQQFDFLLAVAVERYTERVMQRCMGASNALLQLRTDPQGAGVWLDAFVDAMFAEFLLDNVAGALFVLEALVAQPWPQQEASHQQPQIDVGTVLQAAARTLFSNLLRAKSIEALEQATLFE